MKLMLKLSISCSNCTVLLYSSLLVLGLLGKFIVLVLPQRQWSTIVPLKKKKKTKPPNKYPHRPQNQPPLPQCGGGDSCTSELLFCVVRHVTDNPFSASSHIILFPLNCQLTCFLALIYLSLLLSLLFFATFHHYCIDFLSKWCWTYILFNNIVWIFSEFWWVLWFKFLLLLLVQIRSSFKMKSASSVTFCPLER